MHRLLNPIIPGYYPDPSICRVDDDFYIACSSFEMYPGIPIFHSRDLVHWEQFGNAMTAENGFHVERNGGIGGVMAPTLRYREGLFCLIHTNFSGRGNCIVTARDPAGPWSHPHWMDDVPGIDASLSCGLSLQDQPQGAHERRLGAAGYHFTVGNAGRGLYDTLRRKRKFAQ